MNYLLLVLLALAPSMTSANFSDVSATHTNKTAIDFLASADIIHGHDESGLFMPDDNINRAEFVKVVIHTKYDASDLDACDTKSTTEKFSDVDGSEWYLKELCVAEKNGVIGGYPDGTFGASNNTNYAEAAKIILETLDVPTTMNESSWYQGYINTLKSSQSEPRVGMMANENITRGEMAEVIYRLDLAGSINVGKDIVETAIETEVLSTLVAAVTAADLVTTLQGDGPFTVFAPTNDAFAGIQSTVDTLLLPENQADLQNVLTYHVVAGNVMAADLTDGMMITTVQGQELMVSIIDGVVKINGATVVMADVNTSNGVVHVIDTVLVPTAETVMTKDIVETAIETEVLSTLVAAVTAADLVTTLQGDGPFTVFAPTNDAFAGIQSTVDTLLLPENNADLQDVLTYHVVAGNVMAADLTDGMMITTVQGQELTVSIMDGVVKINGATVVMADVNTSNGVVHVIDTVLVP